MTARGGLTLIELLIVLALLVVVAAVSVPYMDGAFSRAHLSAGGDMLRDAVVGYADSVTAYERLAGPRFLVELLAANHLSVVDDCFNHELDVSLCVPEDITQEAAHELVLHYALPFTRRYLRGDRKAGRIVGRPVTGVELHTEP